jgi:hypothetical protein
MGIRIINDPELPVNELKKIPSAKKSKTKIIPPIISNFQAIARTRIKTKTGILLTRNPVSCLPTGSFPPKTSRENIIINRIARIARIRGNQNKIRRTIVESF